MQFVAIAADVPAALENALKTKFPSATDVEWYDEYDGSFSAFFFDGEDSKIAKFDASGSWLETRIYLDQEQIPQTIMKAIQKSKYADFTISTAIKIELPAISQYEINAETKEKAYLLMFDEKGILLSATEEPKDVLDDEDETSPDEDE